MTYVADQQASGLYVPGALVPITTEGAVNDLREFAVSDHARFGTGWSLDDSCGQPGVGEMALVWARSSTGKSTLMLNVINNVPDVPTAFFNMEMPPRMMADWLVSMSFDLQTEPMKYEHVIKAGPSHPHYAELNDALNRFPAFFPELFFFQAERPSVMEMDIALDRIFDDTSIEVKRVFIDHVGLMVEDENYQSFTRVLGDLHGWALRRDISLWVVQQTKRGSDAGANDGHIPVTLGSGVFAGEAHADWIFGLYRPEFNPRFMKPRSEFKKDDDYWEMLAERENAKGLSIVQLVKNRVYGATNRDGIPLRYDTHTRRLTEGLNYA